MRRDCLIAIIVGSIALSAQPAWAEGRVAFQQDVLPILHEHCVTCHGESTRKADLSLASAAAIQRGSEGGSILDGEDFEETRLWEVLSGGEMPPEGEGEPLTAEQLATIRRWLQQGALLPSAESAESTLNQHDAVPILLRRCATCHGRQRQESELDVRTLASLLQGGKSGPALVPGQPAESRMIQRIERGEMPPKKELAKFSIKPVSASELEILKQWVTAGAPWEPTAVDAASSDGDPLVSDEDRRHWAFQPPQLARPPADSQRYGHPVDAFIAKALAERGWSLAKQADRATLIRRVTFDMTGLPPSPEEVEAFCADTDPLAYLRVVDRLLASPAYGERWGQIWLDLAGYADSEGVQHADPVRPHAYRYRDYVIRSLNADVTYDRFLLQQIAGDELADYENAAVVTAEIYDNLVATGFLRMSSDGTFAGITGFLPNRLDVIDDQIRILTSSVMGLTVRCARCHSHKFDPIPQRDYYRLSAVFKGAMDEFDWLRPLAKGVGPPRYLPYVPTEERAAWERSEAEINRHVTLLEKEKAALQEQAESEPQKKRLVEIDAELATWNGRRQTEPMIRALWDRGQPSPTYLLRRGDYLQTAHVIGPGVPSVLTDGSTPFDAQPPWPGAEKTGNRLALARWLIQPDHPLTARVMVNRIWKHHFGRGIVEPLDDFGRAGGRPTHPELLDWLAREFVRAGWSIKHLHRLLVTSATYCQKSQATSEQQQLDPQNHWLARMPLRRLTAEELRDTLLSISGKLNRAQFGPADPVEADKEGLVTTKPRPDGDRRSIYIQKRRTEPLTILDCFDRPRMSPNCIDRAVSNVSIQALHLMNNQRVHKLSLAMADAIIRTVGDEPEDQIERLCLLAYGRKPRLGEQEALTSALSQFRQRWLSEAENDSASLRALGNLCHAMMNSASLLYVD